MITLRAEAKMWKMEPRVIQTCSLPIISCWLLLCLCTCDLDTWIIGLLMITEFIREPCSALLSTWSAFSPFPPFLRCGSGLRFVFRCLRFLHLHAPTPALITLQTSLKWINFLISGSSPWIISRVHIVCDYCSVTPDADPELCYPSVGLRRM